MTCFLGLDLGTSGLKAIIVDEDQHVLASMSAPLATTRPRPGWSEQDPETWWQATETVLGALASEQPRLMRRVAAIGLSGQMHAALLLDKAHRPCAPAILWNDGRARDEAAELAAQGLDLAAELGVPAMPGFTAPKLMWLRRHQPTVMDEAAILLLPKDYVRLKLTGDIATDVSDAAGTWLLDQAARQWSARAIAACGIDAALLPRVLEASAPAGHVRPALAARFGLSDRVLVAAGGGDTAVGGLGIGACSDGKAFVSLGTSGQFFLATDAHRPAPERFVHAFAHAVPAGWYQMGAALNGASVLAYTAHLMGEADIGRLLGEVEAAFSRPSSLLFLPYLAGERTPHNDPDARGVIFGLAGGTPRADVMQAALEGVAFSIADCLDAVTSASPRPDVAGFIGGGARSRLWARILAAVLDMPIRLLESAEAGPAFGAARLARLAAGGSAAATIVEPPLKGVVEPERALVGSYQDRLASFRALYRALKPSFAAGSRPG